MILQGINLIMECDTSFLAGDEIKPRVEDTWSPFCPFVSQ